VETDRAEDLAQQVMVNVARVIGAWQKDPQRGTFHGWLLRIARNAIVNSLARGRPDAARGGTSVLLRLRDCPSGQDDVEVLVQDEYQRMLFRWAAAEVQLEFQPETWRAFWLTAVEDMPVEQVATELGKSAGSVYAARSRIMRRLKDVVRELEEL
jgi:RNA polymerase sigma factor (sigma-70 family)